jgi:hypothetical protein
MPKFTIVNPFIEGKMNKTCNAKTPIAAAKETWCNLSKNFSNNVPKFAFTLENESDGSLSHFSVTEKIVETDVDYLIKELNLNLSESNNDKFKNEIHKLKQIQIGGKSKYYKDDDDDDNDAIYDDLANIYDNIRTYKQNQQNWPVYYWWYFPSLYKVEDLYIPTFTAPFNPYAHLKFPFFEVNSYSY